MEQDDREEETLGKAREKNLLMTQKVEDLPCHEYYQQLFFTDKYSPYTKTGLAKLQWEEQQVVQKSTTSSPYYYKTRMP